MEQRSYASLLRGLSMFHLRLATSALTLAAFVIVVE